MESKHPLMRAEDAARLSELRAVASAAATHLDADAVANALSSFSRGSAGGSSGLRPQHLKEAVVLGLRDEVLRHLADVVNLTASGGAPPEIQEWLCGASLTALPKSSGDLRPVAVGRNLAALDRQGAG